MKVVLAARKVIDLATRCPCSCHPMDFNRICLPQQGDQMGACFIMFHHVSLCVSTCSMIAKLQSFKKPRHGVTMCHMV